MNSIDQDEFERVLTAGAESLVPGIAPTEAVLAGARRRGVRRRAAVATAGMLAVTGVAVEVGALGGGSSGAVVGAGQSPAAHSPTSPGPTGRSAPGNSLPPRVAPKVTQQAGLAPGQHPMAEGTVVASGTVGGGTPWQVVVTDTPGQTVYGPNNTVLGTDMYHWTSALYVAGKDVADVSGETRTKDEMGATGVVWGDADAATILVLVDPDVVKVAWVGPDGFRQEAPAIPTAFGKSVAVFPDSLRLVSGDKLVEYDASGKEVRTLARMAVPSGYSTHTPGQNLLPEPTSAAR